MVRLKLAAILILLALLSLTAHSKIDPSTCHGPDVKPSRSYQAKIERSLKLFSKKPGIIKPKFLVRETGSMCHNAWADTQNNRVILSEPVIKDFPEEELAGIIAHEIAHLEFPGENDHWRTDLRGAQLTSTKIMLSKLNRMKSISTALRRQETSNLYTYEWEIEDYTFRIDKIKNH